MPAPQEGDRLNTDYSCSPGSRRRQEVHNPLKNAQKATRCNDTSKNPPKHAAFQCIGVTIILTGKAVNDKC